MYITRKLAFVLSVLLLFASAFGAMSFIVDGKAHKGEFEAQQQAILDHLTKYAQANGLMRDGMPPIIEGYPPAYAGETVIDSTYVLYLTDALKSLAVVPERVESGLIEDVAYYNYCIASLMFGEDDATCTASVFGLQGTTSIKGTMSLYYTAPGKKQTLCNQWKISSAKRVANVQRTVPIAKDGTYEVRLDFTVKTNGVQERITHSVSKEFTANVDALPSTHTPCSPYGTVEAANANYQGLRYRLSNDSEDWYAGSYICDFNNLHVGVTEKFFPKDYAASLPKTYTKGAPIPIYLFKAKYSLRELNELSDEILKKRDKLEELGLECGIMMVNEPENCVHLSMVDLDDKKAKLFRDNITDHPAVDLHGGGRFWLDILIEEVVDVDQIQEQSPEIAN